MGILGYRGGGWGIGGVGVKGGFFRKSIGFLRKNAKFYEQNLFSEERRYSCEKTKGVHPEGGKSVYCPKKNNKIHRECFTLQAGGIKKSTAAPNTTPVCVFFFLFSALCINIVV